MTMMCYPFVYPFIEFHIQLYLFVYQRTSWALFVGNKIRESLNGMEQEPPHFLPTTSRVSFSNLTFPVLLSVYFPAASVTAFNISFLLSCVSFVNKA